MVLDVRFFLRFTLWFWGTDMIFLTVLDWQHCIYISLSYCEVPSLKALGTSIQIHIYPGRLTECQAILMYMSPSGETSAIVRFSF